MDRRVDGWMFGGLMGGWVYVSMSLFVSVPT